MQRINSFAQFKTRTDRPDHAMRTIKSDVATEPIHGLNPGAVSDVQAVHAERLQFTRGPGEGLIAGGKKMQSADQCVDSRFTHDASCVLQRIDNSSMSAAAEHNESLIRIEHQRHVLRKIVFYDASRSFDAT